MGKETIGGEYRLTKKDRIRLKAVSEWVCLNVFIYMNVMMNYWYTTMLHEVIVTGTIYTI